MEISGKVAVVTGGASGLGAATAKMIVEEGGHVVIVDLNEQAGHPLAKDLGAKAPFFRPDVSNPVEAQAAVESAVETFGALHISVQCAGIVDAQRVIGKTGPADLARFSKHIGVNLIGTFNVARLAGWLMATNAPNEEGERGVIVNTASVAAFDGQIGQAAYSASKGGIAAMTLPLARDIIGNPMLNGEVIRLDGAIRMAPK